MGRTRSPESSSPIATSTARHDQGGVTLALRHQRASQRCLARLCALQRICAAGCLSTTSWSAKTCYPVSDWLGCGQSARKCLFLLAQEPPHRNKPAGATNRLPKLDTRVRFPSSAPTNRLITGGFVVDRRHALEPPYLRCTSLRGPDAVLALAAVVNSQRADNATELAAELASVAAAGIASDKICGIATDFDSAT